MVNTSLKVPTLGITDLSYLISNGRMYILIEVVRYTSTYMIFNVQVNANSYLSQLKLTYMALDNSFTPAFSMNYFFPVKNTIYRELAKMDQTSTYNTMLTSQPQQESYSTPAIKTYYYPSSTTWISIPQTPQSTYILISH